MTNLLLMNLPILLLLVIPLVLKETKLVMLTKLNSLNYIIIVKNVLITEI